MSIQNQAPLVDVPFDKRHQCWFCDEPCNQIFQYISHSYTSHPSLAVPACKECHALAKNNPLTSIWDCRDAVKDELMRIYNKHLAIGINWTQQELEDSEFECKALGGFKKSAWLMYTIAKDRMNANGWPLQLNGVLLDDSGANCEFVFDGLRFTSVYRAVNHYAQHYNLDKKFLSELVTELGTSRFGYSVRLAQIHLGSNKEMKRHVLIDIKQQEHN